MEAKQIVEREQTGATSIIQVIERASLNPDVDIDKMERLLQMHERIVERDAKMAYASALAELQAELPVITEQGEIKVNNVVRSKYAKFEDINEAVKPVLQKYGFAVSFRTDIKDGAITVTAVLSHRAGHSENTSMILPADNSGSKNNVQAIGSSVAYGKRYTMCALLNITSRGEDNDGNKPKNTISDEQIANLDSLITEVGADKKGFLAYLKLEKLQDLEGKKYQQAVRALEQKRKQCNA